MILKSKKKINFLTGSIFLVIANAVAKLTIFIIGIVAARLLSQDSFGQFSMIRSTITAVGSLLAGTVGTTSTKNISENDGNKTKQIEYVYSVIVVNFIFTLMAIILFIIASNYQNNDFLEMLVSDNIIVVISSGLLFFTNASILLQGVLIGLEKYKQLLSISFIVAILILPIGYIFISWWGFDGALVTFFLYYLFDSFFKIKVTFSVLNNSRVIIVLSQVMQVITGILRSNILLLLVTVIVTFSFWYSRVLVIKHTGDFEKIAIYDAAFQWLSIIMLVTTASTSVALAKMAKPNANKINILKNSTISNLLVSIPVSFVFIFFSEHIMSLYGSDYVDGAKTLSILSVASNFFSLSTIFNRYVLASSNIRAILIVTVISSSVMFVTLYFFIELADLGLAYSTLSFYSTSTFLYICYLFFESINKNDNSIKVN
ncbi:oligosaccharide flippase family protein [Aeromonas caviae]